MVNYNPRTDPATGKFLSSPPEVLFAAKVARAGEDECWLWLASTDRDGYGKFAVGLGGRKQRHVRAHVFAWESANGRRKTRAESVLHTCDNPPCCNPKHLFVGDAKSNFDDARRKGRIVREPTGNGGQTAWAPNGQPKANHSPVDPPPIRHGAADFAAGRCRCETCAEAFRSANARNQAARVARGCPDGKHGTATGYTAYGCRCDRCRSANAEAYRRWSAAKKAELVR